VRLRNAREQDLARKVDDPSIEERPVGAKRRDTRTRESERGDQSDAELVSRSLREAEVGVGVAVAALVDPALALLGRKVLVLAVEAKEVGPLDTVEYDSERDERDGDLGAGLVARRIGRDIDAACGERVSSRAERQLERKGGLDSLGSDEAGAVSDRLLEANRARALVVRRCQRGPVGCHGQRSFPSHRRSEVEGESHLAMTRAG
jgi:hypothetical protein